MFKYAYLKSMFVLLSFIPLLALADTVSLSLSPSTEQAITSGVATGAQNIDANIAATEAAQTMQANGNGANLPPTAKPVVKPPAPAKPDITDSTKAAASSEVTLENQADTDSMNQTPTGFIGSGEEQSVNSSATQWDYGF